VLKRAILVIAVLALAAPLAASAGSGGSKSGSTQSTGVLAPALEAAAAQNPNSTVPVIVLSDDGAAQAEKALDKVSDDESTKLDIVDAAAGSVRAGDLRKLAKDSKLDVIPDEPVVLDSLHGWGRRFDRHDNGWHDHKPQKPKPNAPAFSSSELWPSAVGVDQLWQQLADRRGAAAPSIAFVDSGIDASRSDFAGRVLAQVDLTSLPGNSRGDGRGHGTLVAGLAAGSAPGHAGAAPTAGIVSLDVMDDQGMARTSDVIEAAQWILKNHDRYGIRVANFSLHSSTPSSFRWDPLDKAIEKLWFSGVVVVTSSGNYGVPGKRQPVAFAPANDPFAITVGALDIGNSTSPDRATVAPWSVSGYTLDGFAKPEVSAPGRNLVGPIPADSTLAQERPGQLIRTPNGTYVKLSGTSLSAPIVAGLAADILALHPHFTPDQVKGALMVSARPVRHARIPEAGVGEVYAPGATALTTAPNPNLALERFLIDDHGLPTFDGDAWVAAAKASNSWDSVSWLDGWSSAAWSDVSWSDVSWSDVSWSDVSWSDVSWSDVSWSDVSWADVSWADTLDAYGDVG